MSPAEREQDVVLHDYLLLTVHSVIRVHEYIEYLMMYTSHVLTQASAACVEVKAAADGCGRWLLQKGLR